MRHARRHASVRRRVRGGGARPHRLRRRLDSRAGRGGQAHRRDRPRRVPPARRAALLGGPHGRRLRGGVPAAAGPPPGGMSTARPAPGDVIVGEQYYILASELAADLPKLVLKHDEAFVVANRRGDLPNMADSEFGFYVDGTRFLRQLELRVHGHRPIVLNAGVSEDAMQASIDLTNPDVPLAPHVVLPGRSLRVARRLTVHAGQLYQLLLVESFTREPHDLVLTLSVAADFVDVFEVRGHPRERRGEMLPPRAEAGVIRLGYRGLDDITRTTTLTFTPAPSRVDAD